MKELIEAKLKLAQEQQTQWQQRIIQAQEQIIRWDAVRLFCEEMLREGGREHEDVKGNEGREEESPRA